MDQCSSNPVGDNVDQEIVLNVPSKKVAKDNIHSFHLECDGDISVPAEVVEASTAVVLVNTF